MKNECNFELYSMTTCETCICFNEKNSYCILLDEYIRNIHKAIYCINYITSDSYNNLKEVH